jgi:hypothetical protein
VGTCDPFTCEAGACRTSCESDLQCVEGAHCSGGQCQGNKANGSLCGKNGECGSGHCALGICCGQACEPGPKGTCLTSGVCNSNGVGCALWDAATSCAEPRCLDGELLSGRLCDGSGVCKAATSTPCAGHFGCADARICKTACATHADCHPGFFCQPIEAASGLECRKQKNGETCALRSDCASDHCVQGVCCATPCTDQGAASCGTLGTCIADEASPRFGQCALYPAGTACRGQICANDRYTPAQSCAGDASPCPAGAAQDCPGGAQCAEGGVLCLGQCELGTHNGCADGKWCRMAGGVPTCEKNNQQHGEPCGSVTDCAGGGTCDHGICCAGPGTCCLNRNGCPLDENDCTNVSTCTSKSVRWSCDDFTCVSNTGGVDNCNGKLAAVCQGNIRDAYCPIKDCPTSCEVAGADRDALCDPGFYCLAGSCVAQLSDQASCARPTQCKGGTCLNGLCCGAATKCCTSSADCTSRCTSPSTCQGYLALCQSSNCSTSSVDSSAPDDSACLYSTRSPAERHLCSATGLIVPCNGAAVQAPEKRCNESCASVDKVPGQCSENTASAKAPFCHPGMSCSMTNEGTCTGYCTSCMLSGIIECALDPRVPCPKGTTCKAVDSAKNCMAACQ